MTTSAALTEHHAIKAWAEARHARPALVKGTGNTSDAGRIRLDFPGYSGGDLLEEISWEQWFARFEENNLALVVQDATTDAQRSNFSLLVGRDRQPSEQPVGSC